MAHNHPSWRRRNTGAFCLLLLTISGGCESFNNSETVVGALVDPFFPPTPGEAARMALDPSSPDNRRKGVTELSNATFGGEAAYLKLYRTLATDTDSTVRAACLKALGQHGQVDDALILIDALDDSVPFVRWEAAKGLQRIHNPAAIDRLIEVVEQDEDTDVRVAAAHALGQYRQPEVVPVLIGALDAPSYSLVTAAKQSLTTLTGQELGDDASKWLAWTEANTDAWFANAQTYKWQPYVPPEKFIEKMQFWKERQIPQPEPPTGLEQPVQPPKDT